MKILIVKTSSLGDVVQSLPILSYLKEKGKVDWVAEERVAPLLLAHPFVHKVYSVNFKKWTKNIWATRKEWLLKELRKESYDLLFDLQGNTKSAFITFLAKAKKKIGFRKVSEWPNLLVTSCKIAVKEQGIQDQYLELVQSAFKEKKPATFIPLLVNDDEKRALETFSFQRPAILVCPFSRWPSKEVPIPLLAAFLSKIEKNQNVHFFILFGSEKEKVRAKELQDSLPSSELLGGLTLPLLSHLMARMDAVIGVDSLPLHLASFVAPTFGLFGPTKAEVFLPGRGAFQGRCDTSFTKRCLYLRKCSSCKCFDVGPEELFSRWELFRKHQTSIAEVDI